MLKNKYTNWYFKIIESAKNRTLPSDTYVEVHHIIPKSCGGSNDKTNLVALTAREHFVCHWLLTKMYDTEKYKKNMIYAFWSFVTGQSNALINERVKVKITARTYEMAKILFASAISDFHKNKKFSDYTKQLMSKSAKIRASKMQRSGKNNAAWKGQYYITPWGTFNSTKTAIKACPGPKMDEWSLITWCKNNLKTVGRQKRAKYFSSDMIGKTFRELGFYYVTEGG